MAQLTYAIIAASFLLFGGGESKLTHLRNVLLKESERKQAEIYLRSVVNATEALLKMPPLLEPNTSPRKFIDEQKAGEYNSVIVGIIVENYSKLRLTDPKTSGTNDCGYSHEINYVGNVEPGSYDVFAIDNGAHKHRGVCGSLSWQISEPSGRPLVDSNRPYDGRRLVISYDVPHDCTTDYPNSFSVNIWHSLLNKTGHWKEPNLVNTFYTADLYRTGSSKAMLVPLTSDTQFSYFDSHRFLISGSIETGCEPLLKVRLLPGEKLRDALLWGKPGPQAEKHTVPVPAFVDPTDSATAIGLEQILHFSVIGGLSLIAVVLSVCLLKSVARRGREKRVSKFAQELAGGSIEEEDEE